MRKEITIPECMYCKHFVSIKKSEKGYSYCTAFPDGIPPEIFHSSKTDVHSKVLDGQVGNTVFECIDDPKVKRLYKVISSK